jgi:hypothetical protein
MSRFWDGILENPLNALNPASYRPVDPEAGSQGASRDAPGASHPQHGGMFQSIADFGRGISQEGLGGLFDYSGMMDRQQAQRELASRFNVLPDGTPGERSQNQVSEEQFQQIARTYSDIRLGRGDLTLAAKPAGMSDADYATFRQGSMNDIADILQTESGRGLVGSLHDAPLQADGVSRRPTVINPRLDAANQFDPSNATGGGRFGQSGTISYVPGVDAAPNGSNLRSDATLYHEMVHAHHAVYNTWDATTVGSFPMPFGLPNFENTADPDYGLGNFEHQAAGLGIHANDPYSENRYRGERAEIGRLDVGERTTGSETDDGMMRRDQYRTPRNPDGTVAPRTTPATIPALVAGGRSAPSGDAVARIGQSTDGHDHDHDHAH